MVKPADARELAASQVNEATRQFKAIRPDLRIVDDVSGDYCAALMIA